MAALCTAGCMPVSICAQALPATAFLHQSVTAFAEDGSPVAGDTGDYQYLRYDDHIEITGTSFCDGNIHASYQTQFYCDEDALAQEFAEANNIKTHPLSEPAQPAEGDFNNDGEISVGDPVLLAQFSPRTRR